MPTPMKDFDIQSFRGEDTTAPRGAAPENVFRRFRNVKLDYTGTIRKTAAPALIKSGVSAYQIWRYDTALVKRLMYTTYTLTPGPPDLYVIALMHLNEASIATAPVNAVNTGSIDSVAVADYYTPAEIYGGVQILQERDIMLMAVPADKLYVWYGDVTIGSGKEAGVEVPITSPTLTPGGAGSGVLNSMGNKPIPKYEYRYTFVTAHGQEGNPSDPAEVNLIDDEYIDVIVSGPLSGTPEITKARIYRRGGFATQFFMVGDVTLVPGPTTFHDNIADIDLSNTRLSLNNYAPPTGLDIIASHRQRIYAAGSKGFGESASPIRIWFSGISKPEQWGRSGSGAAIDGGFFDMPGADSDNILALTSIGNILIVGRALTVYVLYGNGFTDFNPSKRSDVGIASKHALCRTGLNDAFWMGRDRRIYKLTNDGAEMISAAIQSSLDLIPAAQFSTVRLVSHDNKLYVTFSTSPASPDDLTFVLDFTNGAWSEETDLISRDMVSQPPPTGDFRTHELIFSDTSGNIKRAFADVSSERYVSIRTPEYEMPGVARAGKTISSAYWSHIEGTLSNGSDPATNLKVGVTADTYSRVYGISAANGYDNTEEIIFTFRPDVDLFGRYISQQIEGRVTALQLKRIVTTVQLEREDG